MTSARMSPEANSKFFLAPRGILECGSSGSLKLPGGLSGSVCAPKSPGGRSGPGAGEVLVLGVAEVHEVGAEGAEVVAGPVEGVEEGLIVGRCNPGSSPRCCIKGAVEEDGKEGLEARIAVVEEGKIGRAGGENGGVLLLPFFSPSITAGPGLQREATGPLGAGPGIQREASKVGLQRESSGARGGRPQRGAVPPSRGSSRFVLTFSARPGLQLRCEASGPCGAGPGIQREASDDGLQRESSGARGGRPPRGAVPTARGRAFFSRTGLQREASVSGLPREASVPRAPMLELRVGATHAAGGEGAEG